MLITKRDLTVRSSPAQHPQYDMQVPAGTRCREIEGQGIVVVDVHKVRGSSDHDLAHYYVWIDRNDVEESEI